MLLSQELERIRVEAKHEAKILLDTLEMLLLLVWRHVEYYAEPRHMNMPPAKATITNAMRLLATAEPEVFRAEVASKIQPALQRLSSLDLVSLLLSGLTGFRSVLMLSLTGCRNIWT